MIVIDFECTNTHRFEGYFKDYQSYSEQHESTMISCPVCGSESVKRLFTGCSINTGSRAPAHSGQQNLFEIIRSFNRHIVSHFDYVGGDFADISRAIHYGIEKKRGIYGESSAKDLQELHEERIPVLPLVEINTIEN